MNHRDAYRTLKEAIDERLPLATAGRVPESLYEPTRYILEGGGKRVRGVLLLLACRATGQPAGSASTSGASSPTMRRSLCALRLVASPVRSR